MLLTSKLAGEKLAPSMTVLERTETPDASKLSDCTVSLKSDDILVGVSISAKDVNEGSPITEKQFA